MMDKLSLPKDKIRIVLLEGVHQRAVEVLASYDYTNVEHLSGALTEAELIETIKDAFFVGIRSRTQLSAEVLRACNRLMAIGCFCIGTNQVDLKVAAELGIPVFNAPHSNTRSVAELVIGHTVMLMRGIFPKSLAAHRGTWLKSAKGSNEVRGKTIGIVGYGHIGTQVSVLAESMGMNVLFYDIQAKLPLGNARSRPTLESLLQDSDIVTLHVPADPSTVNLMNQERLGLMKENSYLINASRGSVVDIEALAGFLKSGHLGGAAVDVFPTEPESNQLPFTSPLQGLEQVILTPHIGGSTLEAQINIGEEVANKLVMFSDRGVTDGTVNFPIVNLPSHEGAHRILHVHHNVPGIMLQINRILGEAQINVVGQYLSTHKDLGYVVVDVEKAMDDDQLDQLLHDLKTQVKDTIRARVLH